jgi:hypothetical protein
MSARLWIALLCLGAVSGGTVADERPPVLSRPVVIEHPPAAFVTVNKLLREAKCIRAAFTEEKVIKVLKRPLASSGTLIFSSKWGLYRAAKQPFVQELLVNTAGIAQRDANGKIEKLDVEKAPLAKGVIDAFLLVFSGDDKALAADFDLFFDGEAADWTLGLVPKKKPLSQFIASLIVTGKKGVLESLVVFEVNGDKTTTRFTDVINDRELSADEQERYFGWRK